MHRHRQQLGPSADAFDLDGDGNTDETIPIDRADIDCDDEHVCPRFVDDTFTSPNGLPCIVDMGAYEFQGSCFEDADCRDCNVCTCEEGLDGQDCSVCTWDRCGVDNLCTYTRSMICDLDHNGVIGLFDLFGVLDCIAGEPTEYTCELGNVEPCSGSGTLNVIDVLVCLDAIAGEDPCCDWLP